MKMLMLEKQHFCFEMMRSASQCSSEEEELATTDAALLTHNHAGELSSCSSKNTK